MERLSFALTDRQLSRRSAVDSLPVPSFVPFLPASSLPSPEVSPTHSTGLPDPQGLRINDVFLLFDTTGDGLLSSAELYGGLEWLGVRLLPAEVKPLLRFSPAAEPRAVAHPS